MSDEIRLIAGDCLDVLPTLDENSVDAIATDPPYFFEFMGSSWDKIGSTGATNERFSEQLDAEGRIALPVEINAPFGGGGNRIRYGEAGRTTGRAMQEWHEQWARAALRVLKPGGYAVVFGGPRTFHRLMCAFEDAGFEPRDVVMYLFGSGFPKGKGQLKPAYEPILLCRKPGPKVLPLGIDECRIPSSAADQAYIEASIGRYDGHRSLGGNGAYGGGADVERFESYDASKGRWPANIVHDGSDQVKAAFSAFGDRPSTLAGVDPSKDYTSKKVIDGGIFFGLKHQGHLYADDGSAARFFFEAEPDLPDAEMGQPEMPSGGALGRWPANVVHDGSEEVETAFAEFGDRKAGSSVSGQEPSGVTNGIYGEFEDRVSFNSYADGGSASRFFYAAKAGSDEREQARDGTRHPTVKPLSLMTWLVKLVCPEGGLVIDPFLGSGTTALACIATGRRVIGIERDPTYMEIAEKRIAKAPARQIGLFADAWKPPAS